MSETDRLRHILEAALLAAGRPLSIDEMLRLFLDAEQPDRKQIRAALEALAADYEGRGLELRQVASGWRIQVRQEMSPWVSRLWEEKPPRYSRALLETLAIIAYRQPVTRGEIEDIRGVSVSSSIIRTLEERDWVRVVGHREVPGRPAVYATTRAFLDYFNLKSLEELPTLAELRDPETIGAELGLELPSADEAARPADAETAEAEGVPAVPLADEDSEADRSGAPETLH